jgi:hypothetical protein
VSNDDLQSVPIVVSGQFSGLEQQMTAPHPLDNPVRSSRAGPHALFAERITRTPR